MASRIEQIIEEIEEYIDGCKPQTFSSSKIIVNREEMEELLNELRIKTPEEIKRYQKIISNKEAILADAQARQMRSSHRRRSRRTSWSASIRSCSRHTRRRMKWS